MGEAKLVFIILGVVFGTLAAIGLIAALLANLK